MVLDRPCHDIASLGGQRQHSMIDIAVKKERPRIAIGAAAIDDAVHRRTIATAGPARDHVAEIDHESVRDRRHLDPAAIGAAHLQAAQSVLTQDRDAAESVCAPAPFCPAAASCGCGG